MDALSAFAVLNPQGAVALAERGLMLQALLFMLIVAVPVLGLLFFFAWRYRAGNKKAHYAPNWGSGRMEELVWWVIPLEIVLILGALTWTSTHELDPRRALPGGEPLVVQVVALEGKWLFLYPEQQVASLNEVRFPAGRPVRFFITADAPMNSFWIPQLGGQIYAMTGMVTELNLIADQPGTYQGLSANYSGEEFAHMQFAAVTLTSENFAAWVETVQEFGGTLDHHSYPEVAQQTTPTVGYWGSTEAGLYYKIVGKFTQDGGAVPHGH